MLVNGRGPLGLACLGMGFALACAAPPARADNIWSLGDVTFDDGGTATGWFSLNSLGYLSGFDIEVTADLPNFPAYDYNSALIAAPVFNPGATILDLGKASGPGYLQLDFSYAPSSAPNGGVDPLIIGDGTGAGSYECTAYYNPFNVNPCVAGVQRLVTAGFAEAPEPASLPLLAAALATLFALRPRRRPA